MTQQPDYSILEEGYYAPSPPDQTYNLRPKISLTPLGKNSRACHSIAVARNNHVLQPDSEPFLPVTPRQGLQALEENLSGPVTVQDLHNMVTDNPSIDLTPPIANQTITPEIINHRYNNMDLSNLLDSHGFSAPGDLALHLFTPDPKGAGTSQTFAPASPREVQAFFSTRSFHPSKTTARDSPAFSNSESGPAVMSNISSNSGGRPTNHAQNLLNGCFRELDDLIHKTAVETSRTPENLVNLWLQRQASRRQIKSGWNKYQRYFTDHVTEERERVGDPEASAKDCWPSFSNAYPEWEAILNAHEELHNIQGLESTVAQRQREFKKTADKFSASMADNASRSGFEGFFVIVGNCINEDSGLAHVFVTSGAENVLEDRLGVDKDSLAAQVKAHVYNKISLTFKESLTFNREADLEHAQDCKQVEGLGGHNDDNEVEVTSNAASGSMSYGEMTAEVRKFFHAAFVTGNAVISATQLPWFTLAKTTAEQSRQIINWPEGVPFAGETTQTGQRKAGIKALTTASLTRLYQAFGKPETALRVVPADRAAMLEGKTPVFIGAAPSATGSATHGRRYFLPGRSDNLGLPRLTASKGKPVKVEKPSMLIPSADQSDPLSPLTPTPKHKSKPSNRKGKAKKVESNSEDDDDRPLEVPKRRTIPKPTTNDDDDSDLFLEDSEADVEEVAPVSSTRLRSHGNIAKKPAGHVKKKAQGEKGPSTMQTVSATANKLVTSIIPPTPNNPVSMPRPVPRMLPVKPSAIVPRPPSAPHPPSDTPRPPSARPPSARPPSARPPSARPPSARPPSARPPSARPPTAPLLPAMPIPTAAPIPPAATHSPSAASHHPPTVTHPFLEQSSLSLPMLTPFDMSRNSTSVKRAADVMNDGQIPDIPAKRPRSAEGSMTQPVSQQGEPPITSTSRPSHEPSPPLAPSSIVHIKQEGYAPPLSNLSHSVTHSGHYQDTSNPPLPDQYHGGNYPMYWGSYPSYSHQFKFPPPALLNQPAIYQNSHLPPSSGLQHHQSQGHQPPPSSQLQPSHTSHLQLPPILHLHPPPNSNPYYYNPTQPPPTYGFPPGANYGPAIGGATFQTPYPTAYNAPVEQSHHQEGNSRGTSNGPPSGPNI